MDNITANQAKQIADKSGYKLASTLAAIQNAAEKEMYSVTIHRDLTSIEQKLRDLGYDVNYHAINKDYTFTISWRDVV